MLPVTTYRLTTACSGTYHSAMLGTIEYKLAKGKVTPKNEGEELVLDQVLVPLGYAKRDATTDRDVPDAGPVTDEAPAPSDPEE